jgi:hypothetical protein
VCAQHNNGGLAADHWWQSVNLRHLFPVGEVNGSHGVYRPGGSALNSGQVGGFRAAEFIANRYGGWTVDKDAAREALSSAAAAISGWLDRCSSASVSWTGGREELQARMTRAGAHIRRAADLEGAVAEAWEQWKRIEEGGCSFGSASEKGESLRTRFLCFAHAAYLDAVLCALRSGVGSRGSAIALDNDGDAVHPSLDDRWRILPEDPAFREKTLETSVGRDGVAEHTWTPRRPLPELETWFETAWAAFREGNIYD